MSTTSATNLIKTLSEHHWDLAKSELIRNPTLMTVSAGESRCADGTSWEWFLTRTDWMSKELERITGYFDKNGVAIMVHTTSDSIPDSIRCTARTLNGKQCKNYSKTLDLCHVHEKRLICHEDDSDCDSSCSTECLADTEDSMHYGIV